jgi:hypothetical protein
VLELNPELAQSQTFKKDLKTLISCLFVATLDHDFTLHLLSIMAVPDEQDLKKSNIGRLLNKIAKNGNT